MIPTGTRHGDWTLALSDEDRQKIAQIMREEIREKKAQKPPFPYGKHLFWTVMTTGLWLPVWMIMSLRHDYKWRKSQQERKD